MDIKGKIEKLIKETVVKIDPYFMSIFPDSILEHPSNFLYGDFSSNIAMISFESIARRIDSHVPSEKHSGFNWADMAKNPKELAEKIVDALRQAQDNSLERIEAKNGFINFYLSKEFFVDSVKEILEQKENWGKNNLLAGKKVMIEYTQPNPFKPFHIGHLMSNAIGESISRIFEFSGAKTIRANYQGDVGPHVAKAIYILIKSGLPDKTKTVGEQAQYIGECYSKGSNLYDTDENIKKEIEEINKKIYDKSDQTINDIYDWGKEVTLEAFEEIYKILGTEFNYYFFESEMAKIGEKIVKENIGKIFEESDGAIVFHGENYDKKLHTRVFINSQGLPTYETKEIGLTLTKFEKENLDISIVTTAIEQAEYMKVVQKAISILHQNLESRMKHITHGMMRLTSGKMSSRKGNVVTGESLLRDSMAVVLEKIKDRELTEEEKKAISKMVGVSALKYSILKSSLGSDIIFDFEKSISFEGDSGPYLQYGAVRAKAVLKKAEISGFKTSLENVPATNLELEKLLYRFKEIVEKSYSLLEPHHLANYLTELASAFNTFYGNTQILDKDKKETGYYLSIVKAFYQTMKNGLWLLGIETPEKM